MHTSTEKLSAALADRYQIVRHLGAGGMASVYLAEDLKHGRRVALKVLKPELAAVLGAERFVQEIRTTANLQHPHILPLFDSGTADGFLYYVMPFIDGETVRERLNRDTQFGIDDAVRIAREIADALDHAHRHGVIHRDIKPENVLLQDGRAMVADFGIALAVSAAAGGRMTESGLSLGTPHYMSPEQATAERELTPRSDIYSLGAVLYEMLTGEPPHMGTSAQQIIMKIVTDPVRPVTDLRKSVPPHIAAAVAKSLEKLGADRFDTAKAFSDALANPGFATAAIPGIGSPRTAVGRPMGMTTRTTALAVGMLLVGALLGAMAVQWKGAASVDRAAGPVRFRVTFPDSGFSPTVPAVAVSPDGRHIAYRVGLPSGYSLRLQDLSQEDSRLVPGSEQSPTTVSMTFSPDSRWLAFTSDRDLVRVPVDGGPTTVLVSNVPIGRPIWVSENVIVGTGPSGGLSRLTLTDGVVTQLTSPSEGTRHRSAVATPGGRAIVFTVEHGGSDSLAVASLDGGFTSLGIAGERALGVIDGHLFYIGTDRTVLAVPVELERARVTGSPIPLLPEVAETAQSAMLSPSGTFIFTAAVRDWVVVKVSAQGAETLVHGEPRDYFAPRLSPDGRRIAYAIGGSPRAPIIGTPPEERDVWIGAIGAGTLSPLTSGGGTHPEWSPDGQYVFFLSEMSGSAEIWRQKADFSEPAEQLTPSSRSPAYRIDEGVPSPDGKILMVRLANPESGADLYWMPVEGDTVLRPFVTSPFNDITPRFSPDGKWVAYAANAGGDYEVYVQPFPGPGPRIQVSNGGGRVPLWSRDGRSLYYRRIRENFVADVRPGTPIAFGVPRQVLPPREYRTGSLSHQDYDVTPDGGFLFSKPMRSQSVEVILNLPGYLKASGAR